MRPRTATPAGGAPRRVARPTLAGVLSAAALIAVASVPAAAAAETEARSSFPSLGSAFKRSMMMAPVGSRTCAMCEYVIQMVDRKLQENPYVSWTPLEEFVDPESSAQEARKFKKVPLPPMQPPPEIPFPPAWRRPPPDPELPTGPELASADDQPSQVGADGATPSAEVEGAEEGEDEDGDEDEDQSGTDTHGDEDQSGTDSHGDEDQSGTDSHGDEDQSGTDSHGDEDQSGTDSHGDEDQSGTDTHGDEDQSGTDTHGDEDQSGTDTHGDEDQSGTDTHGDEDQSGDEDEDQSGDGNEQRRVNEDGGHSHDQQHGHGGFSTGSSDVNLLQTAAASGPDETLGAGALAAKTTTYDPDFNARRDALARTPQGVGLLRIPVETAAEAADVFAPLRHKRSLATQFQTAEREVPAAPLDLEGTGSGRVVYRSGANSKDIKEIVKQVKAMGGSQPVTWPKTSLAGRALSALGFVQTGAAAADAADAAAPGAGAKASSDAGAGAASHADRSTAGETAGAEFAPDAEARPSWAESFLQMTAESDALHAARIQAAIVGLPPAEAALAVDAWVRRASAEAATARQQLLRRAMQAEPHLRGSASLDEELAASAERFAEQVGSGSDAFAASLLQTTGSASGSKAGRAPLSGFEGLIGDLGTLPTPNFDAAERRAMKDARAFAKAHPDVVADDGNPMAEAAAKTAEFMKNYRFKSDLPAGMDAAKLVAGAPGMAGPASGFAPAPGMAGPASGFGPAGGFAPVGGAAAPEHMQQLIQAQQQQLAQQYGAGGAGAQRFRGIVDMGFGGAPTGPSAAGAGSASGSGFAPEAAKRAADEMNEFRSALVGIATESTRGGGPTAATSEQRFRQARSSTDDETSNDGETPTATPSAAAQPTEPAPDASATPSLAPQTLESIAAEEARVRARAADAAEAAVADADAFWASHRQEQGALAATAHDAATSALEEAYGGPSGAANKVPDVAAALRGEPSGSHTWGLPRKSPRHLPMDGDAAARDHPDVSYHGLGVIGDLHGEPGEMGGPTNAGWTGLNTYPADADDAQYRPTEGTDTPDFTGGRSQTTDRSHKLTRLQKEAGLKTDPSVTDPAALNYKAAATLPGVKYKTGPRESYRALYRMERHKRFYKLYNHVMDAMDDVCKGLIPRQVAKWGCRTLYSRPARVVDWMLHGYQADEVCVRAFACTETFFLRTE
ncbi:hypothetical protein FNF31_05026 [Cafeteria roenbergensis]|uniref:Uncharacterized protein n=1 Tax=Cafeteria roenbergensis TaxID=33653 RepID=A0A5A8D2Q2_CAFRO|nr:hypothetical protein FNF31_05026 [Cafeteria roenbergensis]